MNQDLGPYNHVVFFQFITNHEVSYDPMTPEDISLITSIINEDIQSLAGIMLNRLNEQQRTTISLAKFETLKKDNTVSECPICYNDKDNNVHLECNHKFCSSCIKRWLTEKEDSCPICRKKIE